MTVCYKLVFSNGNVTDVSFAVYHLDSSSAEPVGGVARFQTVCKYYRDDARFEGRPKLVTLFSGDAFNPSLESSVTKGIHSLLQVQTYIQLCFRWYLRFHSSCSRARHGHTQADLRTGSHMVPVLNLLGTDAACVGVSPGVWAGERVPSLTCF